MARPVANRMAAGRSFSKGKRQRRFARRLIAIILAAAALAGFGLWPASAGADFAAGVSAYDRGDYRAAYDAWLPLAMKGDPAAQRNIGLLFRKGLGVERNPTLAAQWFRAAADLGLSTAQANLGMLYLKGEGVARDYRAAARWLQAAALQGNAIAQYNLGLIHEQGLGVEVSEAKALGWYNLAAKTGYQPALDRLSYLVSVEALEDLEMFDEARRARAAAIPNSLLLDDPSDESDGGSGPWPPDPSQ